MILFLTTQNIQDNVRISEGFRGLLVRVYERLGLESSAAWWNDRLAVRRLGHIIEYGLLGVASGIAFGDTQRLSVVKAVGLCLGISVIDQTIKIFVPVRHFDIIDIGFDAVGAIIGILLTTGIIKLVKRV